MEFWKINGNGNDFIVLDLRDESWSDQDLASLARRLCQRRRSIGADGILAVQQSSQGSFMMRIFNSDGTEGEMCGNGARCVARFAYERAIAGASMCFETLAGTVKATVQGRYVELDLGQVSLDPQWIDRVIELEDRVFRAVYMTVGVPHLVLMASQLPDRETMVRLGRTMRNRRDLFPQGANVNFVRPAGRGEVEAVTYERGVEDLTDSCGTGGVASALAAHLLHRMASPVEVHNPGGTNRIVFEELQSLVFSVRLGGATSVVAQGTLGADA